MLVLGLLQFSLLAMCFLWHLVLNINKSCVLKVHADVNCLIYTALVFFNTHLLILCDNNGEEAPVAEWLRSLTSVLLIIRSSHRCGFAPRTGHEFICETSHVLLAGVSGGFPLVLRFSPHLPIDSSRYE